MEYIVYAFFAMMFVFFCGMEIESVLKEGFYKSQCNKGLILCKYADRYIWLTKQDFINLFFTDRSDG